MTNPFPLSFNAFNASPYFDTSVALPSQIDAAAEKFGQMTQESMTPTVRSTYAWQEVIR